MNIGHEYVRGLNRLSAARYIGRVNKISPTFIEASGPLCTVGDICEIECAETVNGSSVSIRAEVAAIEEGKTVLAPFSNGAVLPGARVSMLSSSDLAPVGNGFSGRLVNAVSEPIDGGAAIMADEMYPLSGKSLEPMQRISPDRIMETGIRAIDGLLTLGYGQRIGIFAASGVGKTTLLSQLAGQAVYDRCVICLVGERGREVEAFWQSIVKAGHGHKTTCVVATSDMSAVLRKRAVYTSISLAEYWRDQGENVLLLIDSVTRFAMALREIGLAAGAPPTLRAYTPNVFDTLPKIVERCGASAAGGTITAIMAVLSETDDVDDPIVEVMKSLLDGHIVLSRSLAEKGHYPAIDILKSISRLTSELVSDPHAALIQTATSTLAEYERVRMLIDSGMYRQGANQSIDLAIDCQTALERFLKQNRNQHVAMEETLRLLDNCCGGRQ